MKTSFYKNKKTKKLHTLTIQTELLSAYKNYVCLTETR